MDQPKGQIIKILYFYVVSLVALFMVVFSLADMVNIALRTYLFPKADENYYGYYAPVCSSPAQAGSSSTVKDPGCISKDEQMRIDKDNREAQRQRDLVRDFSFLIVGIPLFAYHWNIVRRKEI
jgi:hypothetical protein